MEKLIPLYRLDELYTIFYDISDGKYYKINHKERSKVKYFIGLFLLITIGQLIDNIYKSFATPLLNILLLVGGFILTYFIIRRFYSNYFILGSKKKMKLTDDELNTYVEEGYKQYRLELIFSVVGVILGALFAIIFLVTAQVYPLLVSCAMFAVLIIFLFTKPKIRRQQLKSMNKYQSKG